MKNISEAPAARVFVTERKIGNTVFIVSSHFSESSKETAADKMARVLKNKSQTEQKISV